ncbi:MAG: 2'-5' RNA ligase family protein [Propionibacteriales bacterium]|nr:2'-5' RNA ligase family protein [Propionibacteriales bacterium]
MPTIGVAIAIPEPWADVLQQHRVAFGDAQADAIPTHITVVPPTVVDDELPLVEGHLEKVAGMHGAFRLLLRGTGTFRPVSPVVFVAVSQGISSCELLAESARRGPLKQDLEFPYHPHVTVAHDLDEVDLDRAFDALGDFEAAFDVSEVHLYVHGDDGVWRPVKTFSLTG